MPLLNQYDCLINLFIFFICPAHSFDVCRNLTFQLDCFIIRQIVSKPLNFTLFIVNTNCFFRHTKKHIEKRMIIFELSEEIKSSDLTSSLFDNVSFNSKL